MVGLASDPFCRSITLPLEANFQTWVQQQNETNCARCFPQIVHCLSL